MAEDDTLGPDEDAVDDDGLDDLRDDDLTSFMDEQNRDGTGHGRSNNDAPELLRVSPTEVKACHQHIHYGYRGETAASPLMILNYKEYTELIIVVPIAKSKGTNPKGKSGPKVNATYRFHKDHPCYESHCQRVRSKAVFPLRVGAPHPKPPGPMPAPMLTAKVCSVA